MSLSFLLVIVHEMIPHHHHETDDIELFSHQHHKDNQQGNSESDSNHHFPFPAHHHLSVSDDFDIVRAETGFERSVNLAAIIFLVVTEPSSGLNNFAPPEVMFYPETPVPLNSYPFILSPNAMRGSPVFA